jgi:anaerobic selenocysteine-containing dehydrogenase
MCGLLVEIDGREVGAIRGDASDPLSKGHICPKAVGLKDIYADPDRLKAPVVRDGEGWREVSWDEAFDRAAQLLSNVRDRHGRNANGLYLGNPNAHNLGTLLFLRTLSRALGTQNRFSATSVDQLPHHLAALEMFGHQYLLPIPDIDRTDFMVCMGGNPYVSNGSIMTCPDFKGRVEALQERGGRFIVIDPRRTRTARAADEHIGIRPGTDAFMLLALIHELAKLGAEPPAWSKGWATVKRLSEPFIPERAEQATGVSAARIRQLAREFHEAESAAFYGRMGVSTQRFGGLCQWLINVINAVTGNLDREGGVLFTSPAVDIVEPRRAGSFGRRHSRVRGLPEFAGEYPSSALLEELTTPGDGQIRGMVTLAGNPVLSVPGGDALDNAFANLDAYVAIDIYINETTRHADVILPPTTGLETPRYDLVFHLFAVRNTAKYSPAVVSPTTEQRADYEIFRELAKRMATEDYPFDEENPMNQVSAEMALDFALQTGPYELSVDQLLESPEGLDLGPLRGGQLPGRLFTDDQTVNLAPQPFVDDVARLEGEALYDGLLLIGRRHLRSNNSWMHNVPRLMKGKDRCTLLMHPEDAAERGFSDGARVVLKSDAGAASFTLEVSDEMMPGVVCAPHGWGHDLEGVELRTASKSPGTNVNRVTDPNVVDDLTGNAVVNGVPVDVSLAGR